MKKLGNIARLAQLASQDTSTWEQEALQREAAQAWQPKSAAIALQVLRALRQQKLSQKDLAAIMQVSPQYINRVVKGHENLSLETITKLENALSISLVAIYVGENRRVGSGPKFTNMPVDYYRESLTAPEHVSEAFSQFSEDRIFVTA